MKPTRDPLGTGGMDRTAIFAKLKKAWFLVLGLSALGWRVDVESPNSVPCRKEARERFDRKDWLSSKLETGRGCPVFRSLPALF